MPPPPTFDLRLARSRMLSPNVRELGFERADGQPAEFRAGQWLSLVLPLAEGEARRAYSIASAPDGSPKVDIAITKVEGGPGSAYLHDLPEGTIVRAIGPQGFFTRERGNASLFVGTGTGVTPLRSMMLDALTANEGAPLWLLFGIRREEDRLYHEELQALAEKHPNVRVVYSLSRPDEGWSGRTGYVQTHVQELWRELEGANAGLPHAYVCGLERMVSAVRNVLKKEMSVPRQQVHSERYD